MKVVDLLIVSVLLCSQMQAQSKPPKPQLSTKTKSQISKVEAVAQSAPDISKEFMPIARKAFQSIENLNEHFWEDLDKDSSWTMRELAAENARDQLEGVAIAPIEKSIFDTIKADLVFIS